MRKSAAKGRKRGEMGKQVVALKAYNEALVLAKKDYDEACAPALKSYEEARVQAWKAYQEAMDQLYDRPDPAGKEEGGVGEHKGDWPEASTKKRRRRWTTL